MIQQRPILLASKSPRRRQLLMEAGFRFRLLEIDVNEDFPEDMPPEEVAVSLARRKAEAARSHLQNNEIALAADSTVIIENQIFNKPVDYDEAFRMIQTLSGRQHRVITGVCLLDEEMQVSFSGISDVFFAPLTDEEIDYYIRTCKPYDKAGAYGVQEWIGLCKIRRIEGTYANVMGLPVDQVYEALKEFHP